jgi:hypothetical protein
MNPNTAMTMTHVFALQHEFFGHVVHGRPVTGPHDVKQR